MFDLSDFVRAAEKAQLNLYGIVVTQGGKTVAEHRWRSDDRVNIHSLSKSFTSCAVGIARQEGLLDLDEKVIDIFPDKVDGQPSPYLASMTLRHLLTMTPGHEPGLLPGNTRDELEDTDWVHYFMNQPIALAPGSRFIYSSGASFMLSAAIQRRSGKTLREYLIPRLFAPLGIRNPQWFTCPQGITFGGGGLHLRTGEIARFGQLLLDGGCYQGQILVPGDYLRMATSKQVDNYGDKDWGAGYGFQFWMCSWPGAYRGDGLYGQYCLILPEQNAHIAITAHEEHSLQGILDCVWDTIAPRL